MKIVEFEFDNEMDAILKRAGGLDGPGGAAVGEHPDADEIAAFSERALPDASLKRLTAHFADCGRCRRILASTFESPAAEVSVAAPSLVETAVSVPWYRRLFALPQLAAVMGILVIAFGALLVYVTTSNRSTSDMAAAPQDKGFAPPEFPAASNSAANRPANASVPPSAAASNANSSSVAAKPEGLADTENKSPAAFTTPMATPGPNNGPYDQPAPVTLGRARPEPEPEEPRKTNDAVVRDDTAAGVSQEKYKDESARLKSPEPRPAPAPRSSDSNATGAGESKTEAAEEDNDKRDRKLAKKASKPGATRSAGGRTFNNIGGIWFDSAYTNQPQTTVKRGTDAYAKLDSGLRAIADQLGGTVVVLWNGRAYRIQ